MRNKEVSMTDRYIDELVTICQKEVLVTPYLAVNQKEMVQGQNLVKLTFKV